MTIYRCHAYVDVEADSPEQAADRFDELTGRRTATKVAYVAEPDPDIESRLVRKYVLGPLGRWVVAP
jgi:hypothetical protein